MFDNTFSYEVYDKKVLLTIPGYRIIHSSIGKLIEEKAIHPKDWLDVGCGTGKVASEYRPIFPDTRFSMADPSEDMLSLARERNKGCSCYLAPTDELDLDDGSQDIITAILCHHYYDMEGRRKATENCYRMLRPGGLYMTVEHTAPETDDELIKTKAQWKRFLIDSGRSENEAEIFLGRYGTEYFPITSRSHLDILRSSGFDEVGIFVHSCMDIGFFGVKTLTR